MQLSQIKAAGAKSPALSPLARAFTPGSPASGKGGKNLQFLSLPSPSDTPPASTTTTASNTTPLDSAAVLAQQRQRLNASRAAQQHLSVPASAPALPKNGEVWGPPERRPATIDEERKEDTTTAPGTPTDNESWSSMVKTPLVSMFPKGVTGATDGTGKVVPGSLWNTEGVVPQIGDAAIYRRGQKGAVAKKKGGSTPGFGALGGTPAPMPTPNGVMPNTPYNLGMLSAMGLSPEAQLLAVQMFVNGIMPAGFVAPQQHQHQHQHQQTAGLSGGRWRGGQSSAGLKSAGSSKSAGPKSASSNGPSSGVINRDHETDMELLKDIPAWLKALRLHKYAASFEGLTWQEMVVLDEGELEKRGVVTLGARKRFVRLFEAVKKSQGMIDGPGEEAPASAEALASAPVAVAAAA